MVSQVESTGYTCDLEECPLKMTGNCLEGLSISKCPHVTYHFDDLTHKADDFENEEIHNNIPLFSGDELQDADLPIITFSFPAQLILIFGEVNSGKTTLLASLFDLFQKGSFGGYWFAGSRTQIGFEKRCHLARFFSEVKIGDTERTKSIEFSYLHLALKKAFSSDTSKHLLLADVSGERFKLIRDSESEMKKFSILGQADKIFYVVDGDLLSDRAKRHSVKQNLIKLLERIIESGLMPEGMGVNILVTKWDIIKKRDKENEIETFLVEPLKNKYSSLIKCCTAVCSRSFYDATIESGMGLDTFLMICLEKQLTEEKSSQSSIQLLIKREFGKFALR